MQDIIDILTLYGGAHFIPQERREQLLSFIRGHSRPFIVEEMESLAGKDLITLVELYRADKEFRRYLVYNLKEKIISMPNINQRELMTAVIEVIDIPEVRGELIRFALNSEVFYSFPIPYLISLLQRIQEIFFSLEDISVRSMPEGDPLRDLLKTI